MCMVGRKQEKKPECEHTSDHVSVAQQGTLWTVSRHVGAHWVCGPPKKEIALQFACPSSLPEYHSKEVLLRTLPCAITNLPQPGSQAAGPVGGQQLTSEINTGVGRRGTASCF